MARTGRAFPSHTLISNRRPIQTVTYTYSGTGGIVFSGTAAIKRTFGGNVGAGGIVFGGSALVSRRFAAPAGAGGIVFGSSAKVTRGWQRTGAGGVVFGGSAAVNRQFVRTGSGGIVLSGSATMTLISTTPTLAQIEGATRNDIFKRFLRETGLGSYGIITGIGGGATTTFDDTTRLKSAQFNSNDWRGAWARISKNNNTVGVAPEGDVESITVYDPATNGRITAPTFTGSVHVGDEYELWRFPNPLGVIDDLDVVLREDIFLPCWSILSEFPDFDMEQNNTTDWTAGANTTLSKASGEPAMNGSLWLALSTNTNAGSAYNANHIYVEPSTNYHVSAMGYSAGGFLLTLQAYDVTNSAVIKSVTWDRTYAGRLHMEFTTPSTCKEIRIILNHAAGVGSQISYWDDICLYPTNAYDIALPWWVKNKNQIKAVFQLEPTDIAGGTVWDAAMRGSFTNNFEIRDNAFGRGQLRLMMLRGSLPGPLFIFGVRNEVAYANNNIDKKRVDANLIIAALATKVFRRLKTFPNSNAMQTPWVEAQYKEWEDKFKKLQRQQSERVEEIIRGYETSGQHLDSRFAFNR